MIYFTRGWATGELDEAEWEAASAAYRRRLAEIFPSLPATLARLAAEISLNDGLIESARWSPSRKELRLSLVCGDLQQGYSLVELVYGGVLTTGCIDAIRRAVDERGVDLWYDEVD